MPGKSPAILLIVLESLGCPTNRFMMELHSAKTGKRSRAARTISPGPYVAMPVITRAGRGRHAGGDRLTACSIQRPRAARMSV